MIIEGQCANDKPSEQNGATNAGRECLRRKPNML